MIKEWLSQRTVLTNKVIADGQNRPISIQITAALQHQGRYQMRVCCEHACECRVSSFRWGVPVSSKWCYLLVFLRWFWRRDTTADRGNAGRGCGGWRGAAEWQQGRQNQKQKKKKKKKGWPNKGLSGGGRQGENERRKRDGKRQKCNRERQSKRE